MGTRSTKIASTLVAAAMTLSVSWAPAQLARSMDLCFVIIKDAAGVHFYTGDDAVAAHSPTGHSIQPLLAVLTERDSRQKIHPSPIQQLAVFAVLRLAPANFRLEDSFKTFSGSCPSPRPDLQPTLCTFLI